MGQKQETATFNFETVIPITMGKKGIISQMRLAEIQQIQARILSEKRALKECWASVRADLLDDATIEEGPLTAWLISDFVVVRGKTAKHKRSRMRVA